MKKDAVISSCGKYRYALWRIWDESLPVVMFICLNPSTADATKDDNTIRRCISFAKRWGYGGLSMGNLFAFRSTKPKDVWKSDDPVGQYNDIWLKKLRKKAKIAIAAWGSNGTRFDRDQEVARIFKDLYYLKLTTNNSPCHPLYLTGNLKPRPFVNSPKTSKKGGA